MLIPLILLLALLCTNNARRAQIRNLKPAAWVIFTIIAFFTGIFVAAFLLTIIMASKNPALIQLAQTNNREAINKFILENSTQHEFLYTSLFLAGGFGGYLLIRYLIERKKMPVD